MTEQRRREAVERLQYYLAIGTHRKKAIVITCAEYGINRATLYRYCKRFDIIIS